LGATACGVRPGISRRFEILGIFPRYLPWPVPTPGYSVAFSDELLAKLVTSVTDRVEFIQWLWNMVPSSRVATWRSDGWSLTAARMLLSLRQPEFPRADVKDECVTRALEWCQSPHLTERSQGAGLLLCKLRAKWQLGHDLEAFVALFPNFDMFACSNVHESWCGGHHVSVASSRVVTDAVSV
jgi:hypothetical protein